MRTASTGASGEVVEFVADDVALAQGGDDGEDAEVHEGVDEQVDEDAFKAVDEAGRVRRGCAHGDEGEQHVSDVRDGGIGEQALGVGLGEGCEVAAGHGGDGHKYDEWRVDRAQRKEPECQLPIEQRRIGQNADEHGPCGGLHAYGHEAGDGGGRAFVGVGGPLVEGNGGDLEEQADENGDGGDHDDRIVRVFLDQDAANDDEVGAAGEAVEQRKAIGEDAGGERAEEEIFQRGFVGAAVATEEADQDVGRHRHQFEANEE